MLLVVYFAMFISGNFFPHQHDFEGRKVVHSHPYSNPQHGHSQQSLETIHYLSHTVALPGEMCHSFEVADQLVVISPLQAVAFPLVNLAFHSPLRAPPANNA